MTGKRQTLPLVPAIEVGGGHVTVGLVDLPHRRIAGGTRRRVLVNAALSADELIADWLQLARTIAIRPGATWAVASPGPFDYERGIGRFEGVGKFAHVSPTLRSRLTASRST